VLDPVLADAAAAAGASVRFGFTVASLTRDVDGRVDGVAGTDHAGRPTTIRARHVVGADGVGSLVARHVDAPVERVGRGASDYVYRYWSGVRTDGYDWAFRPGRTAGVIPTNDGLACVFVGTDRSRPAPRSLDEYASLLAEASPEVAERVLAGRPEGRARRFRGRPGLVRRPWGPGWVLVGDAGYWKDPISAHGITDALRDAELAAHAIVGTLGSPEADESTWLGAYRDDRDRLSSDLFDVTDRVACNDWTDGEIPQLLWRMSAAMADEVRHLGDLAPWPDAAMATAVGCA
jgi:flavin-dependent dehydrogenase